jgi:hypothetical protein
VTVRVESRRALVTLLAGESAMFTIRTVAVLTKEQVTDRLVLRSANQLTS